MKATTPLISVIIPTFNRATLLPAALASVYKQNITSLQIIVVDDGSTDHTAVVVAGFAGRLDYIYQANRGPAAARNTGLAYARGKWIAFLDSDDVWTIGRLPRQLALAEAYPTAQVIWGLLQVVRQSATDPTVFEPYGGPTLQTQFGSALLHHTLFEPGQVGKPDEALFTNDDADWFCRLLEQNVELVVHQDVVSFYRWHQTNLVANQSATNEQATRGLLHALARSLQRRRQQTRRNSTATLQPNIHWVAHDLRTAATIPLTPDPASTW